MPRTLAMMPDRRSRWTPPNRRREQHGEVVFPQFHSAQAELGRRLGDCPRMVLRCGRRFGKTTLLETVVGSKALGRDGKKGWEIGWFSPNYKLLTPSYKRLLRTLRPVVAHSSKIDALIELSTGGLIEFWTLNDQDAGRSRAYDLAVLDEASLVPEGLRDTWEQAIAPTLLDRRGRAIVAGTPKGISEENFFYQICTDKKMGWEEFHRPTRTNPMLDPEGVSKLQLEYPPLVYQQEFLAEFVDWSGAGIFDRDNLLVDGHPVGYPAICDTVFAVIDSAVKTGKDHDGTAVTYFAMSRHIGIPLVILDWDIVQVEGSMLEHWIPQVFERLRELARTCRARIGSVGVWIEDAQSGTVLLQQCARRGLQAQPIESKLTSVGKDVRAIDVSGYVFQGKVKFCQDAYDKVVNFKGVTRNHLLSQVVGFRVGDRNASTRADDLLDTFCYGVALSLGNSSGF